MIATASDYSKIRCLPARTTALAPPGHPERSEGSALHL